MAIIVRNTRGLRAWSANLRLATAALTPHQWFVVRPYVMLVRGIIQPIRRDLDIMTTERERIMAGIKPKRKFLARKFHQDFAVMLYYDNIGVLPSILAMRYARQRALGKLTQLSDESDVFNLEITKVKKDECN